MVVCLLGRVFYTGLMSSRAFCSIVSFYDFQSSASSPDVNSQCQD